MASDVDIDDSQSRGRELPSLEGIPGTDATSAKRGYYYQDVVTALAWARLRSQEILRIEVAEDLAKEGLSSATVEQVKDARAPITLLSELRYINRFLQLMKANEHYSLRFVYRTTAAIGAEQSPDHRPRGKPGIEYWNSAASPEDAEPLVDVLRKIATTGSPLFDFLDGADAVRAHSQLIDRVRWVTREPSSVVLEGELADLLSAIVHDELEHPWIDGSRLVGQVINEVQKVSTRGDPELRVLRSGDLRRLLNDQTKRSLSDSDYHKLKRSADLIEQIPTALFDQDIESRLKRLRQTRFFAESSPAIQSRAFASEIREGGRLSLGDKNIRATALSWCARLLLEEDEGLARELLSEAISLSPRGHPLLVKALLVAKTDAPAARRLILAEKTELSNTIRYAIERRTSLPAALKWVAEQSLWPVHFDPDGMNLVLADALNEQDWDNAQSWAERIPDAAFDSCPALLWMAALANLASAVPVGARKGVLNGPPTFGELPLMDDIRSLAARRRGAALLRQLQVVAGNLELSRVEATSQEYYLWLELQDRFTRGAATAVIKAKWEKSPNETRWLPLALLAGLKIDRDAAADLIATRLKLYGGVELDDARARMALFISAKVDEQWLEQWRTFRPHLEEVFEVGFLDDCEAQSLIAIERLDDARAFLEHSEHLPRARREALHARLDRSHEAIEDSESSADLMVQHRDPGPMRFAAGELMRAKQFEKAAEITQRIFEMTHDHDDAEAWMVALARLHRWADILRFIEGNRGVVEQSEKLSMFHLIALFRLGRWSDVDELLNSNSDLEVDEADIRVRLAIARCDWASLDALLTKAASQGFRTGQDALRFAQHASILGRDQLAKQFAKAASELSPDDPALLMGCYLISVRGRWDDDPEASIWMRKAVELSGADGPVQSKTLEDFAELIPRWREQERLLGERVSAGEMFLAAAVSQVNRSLANVQLGSANSNQLETDLRRRAPVSAFAGTVRHHVSLRPDVVTFDQAALLTLARLDVLSLVRQQFKRVHVAHSIGQWLFGEAEQIRIVQPSRILDARQLLNSIAAGDIHLAPESSSPDSSLVREVGADLAQLMEAARSHKDSGAHAYAIRSAPIHRPGTLREEIADVTSVVGLLRSPSMLVQSLYQQGVLPEAVHERAMNYLKGHDHTWPDDQTIEPGATLYLDELTVAYFHHLDMWRYLTAARYKLSIHSDVKRQAIALDQAERATQELARTVEVLRAFLFEGFKSGTVVALAAPGESEEEEPSLPAFLLPETLIDAPLLQAIVSDDRAFNRHKEFEFADDRKVVLSTTLDVLDWLREAGQLDEKGWMGRRTELRQFGYLFIPVTTNEYVVALEACRVSGGQLIEMQAARAIRENLLLSQLSGFLQLPAEMPWVQECGNNAVAAIQQLWASATAENVVSVEARANWLVGCYRLDGFFERMSGPLTKERILQIDALTIARLLLPGKLLPSPMYLDWVDRDYVQPLKQNRPLIFERLYRLLVSQIESFAADLHDELQTESPERADASVTRACLDFINDLPKTLSSQILAEEGVIGRLGLRTVSHLTVHIEGRPSFETGEIYAAVAAMYSEARMATLVDRAGDTWEVEQLGDEVAATHPATSRRFDIKHAPLFGNDVDQRLEYLRLIAKDCGLGETLFDAWEGRISQSPLSIFQLKDLEHYLESAPQVVADGIRGVLVSQTASLKELVPLDRQYFEWLVKPWRGESTLAEFAANSGYSTNSFVSLEALSGQLVLSIHASLIPLSGIMECDLSELQEWASNLAPTLDLWSLTGLLEGVVARRDASDSGAELAAIVMRELLRSVLDGNSRLELTAGLASMVDARLHASLLFDDVPVYWRRLASFAHAALLERCLLEERVPLADFVVWLKQFMPKYQIATLSDVGLEPRWNGFMLAPEQLKQELLSRVMNSIEVSDRSGVRESLIKVDSRSGHGTVLDHRNIFGSLPGPLEGGEETASRFPDGLLRQLEEELGTANSPGKESLLVAAHLGSVGVLPDQMLERVIEMTASLEGDLGAVAAWPPFSNLMVRLAMVAAGHRSLLLSNLVQGIARRVSDMPMEFRVYVGITACGANRPDEDWTKSVSDFLNHLSHGGISREDAEHLLSVVNTLGGVRPTLRVPVARTRARLQAVVEQLGEPKCP